MSVEIIARPAGPLQANCYLVFDPVSKAGFAVDPGGDHEMLLATLSDAGITLESIFITHGHADHLGGTAGLAIATGARVYGSGEVQAVLAAPDDYELFPGMPSIEPYALDEVLKGGETIAAAGTEVQVIATPGHSTGSLTYFAGGNIFCGDLLFHGSIGRTDLPGGSFDELASSVKQLILRFPPNTHVYAGHGNLTTLEEEKENNPFLTDLGW